MVVGALIIFFLIVEPHGLARLWQIGSRSCGSGRSPIEGGSRQYGACRPTGSCPADERDGSAQLGGHKGGSMQLTVDLAPRRSRPPRPCARAGLARRTSIFVPLLTYRTGAVRRLAASRSPTACTTISTHAQRARRRHRRRQARRSRNARPATTPRRASSATSGQGQEARWSSIPSRPASRCSSSRRPRSTRSRSCRWPMACRPRPIGDDLPVDLQPAGHLLGRRLDHHQVHRRQGRRPRQAQGQEDRPHLSRRAATARSRSRCSRSSPRSTASS